MLVLKEQFLEVRRASGDLPVSELVDRLRVNADERTDVADVGSIGLGVAHHADTLDAGIRCDPNERVGVARALRLVVLGVHRDELVKVALNRGERDLGDLGGG